MLLPGESYITIEVWDYDDLFNDELIGSTGIDVEDRYYCSKWTNLKDKPIETRKLYHPDFKSPQGNVLMWMEIFDRANNTAQEVDIKLPPKTDLEMRLVIWQTREIPMMDIEETSDVYISAFVDSKNSQTTDTHFRCTTGEASFNWRIVEKIQYDPKSGNTNLSVQVYDKDIFASDDYICSANLNLKKFLQEIYELDLPFTLDNKKYARILSNCTEEEKKLLEDMIEWESNSENDWETKFWLKCSRQDDKGNMIKCGAVLISLEILPMWKADQIKVGKGRDEPNVNPYLPPPFGRIQFSLNPFVLIGQLVGPRLRNKFVYFICGILFSIFLANFLPELIKHLISEVSNPFNYTSSKKN